MTPVDFVARPPRPRTSSSRSMRDPVRLISFSATRQTVAAPGSGRISSTKALRRRKAERDDLIDSGRHQKVDPAAPARNHPEALIEEARRHQRRRWRAVGALLVAVTLAIGLVIGLNGSSSKGRSPGVQEPPVTFAGVASTDHGAVRLVGFHGLQIAVSAGGGWRTNAVAPPLPTRSCSPTWTPRHACSKGVGISRLSCSTS